MTAALTALLAALALAAPEQPQPEIARVRFVTPKLTVSRERADSPSAAICGQLRVDMSGFARDHVKKPVLRIACLCEIDGELVCFNGFWDRPNTYSRMTASAVSEAYRKAGLKFTGEDRKAAQSDPARFTPLLPEVTKDGYATCTYGAPGLNRGGYFRLTRVTASPKILLTRLEVWQNGGLVGFHESPRAGLGKYDLPDDWHAWRKYPQKFKYVDSH